MKKVSIIIIALVTLIGFNACTDDDALIFTAQDPVEAITFINSVSPEYVLTTETLDNTAERFVWESPDFGVDTAITYEIQGSGESTFANFRSLGTTSSNDIAITVRQMFDLAGDAGLDNDPETSQTNADGTPVLDGEGNPVPNNLGEIFFRLVASVGTTDGGPSTTSDVLPVTVSLPEPTGEEPIVLLRELFFVGNATAADWNNNNNNNPMVRDPQNENVYSFRGRINGDGGGLAFKLLEIKGQWQPQWGPDGSGGITNDELNGGDPDAFTVAADGYYDFTVDVENLTFSIAPYDESASVTYPTIGVIGNATNNEDADNDGTPDGWQSDMDLTQSAFDPHIWYINGITLEEGELKFRAQDDWAVNWGNNTELTGFGTMGGPNIPVTRAGTYDIWFNDLDGGYVLIPIVE
ncbi:SusF/SusE family outer membrane protein [Aquimarina sp. 2201CG5-10]|uniref:SusF/SusE family outer membrane protein n=1 Tax=Aquimarina callyspongiae TaxID=3098150 RepID=UPI002AB5D416|nr:SusF/SusE family outer membrane protein [Aquimarina sp. 2201CG5-10]MDY8138190.1 SusF/SusE family outer membrane protein [Aquimarina sp. 2201CG5-10]